MPRDRRTVRYTWSLEEWSQMSDTYRRISIHNALEFCRTRMGDGKLQPAWSFTTSWRVIPYMGFVELEIRDIEPVEHCGRCVTIPLGNGTCHCIRKLEPSMLEWSEGKRSWVPLEPRIRLMQLPVSPAT